MDKKQKRKLKPPEYIDADGKPTGVSLVGDDNDGPVDDAWREAMKKIVSPEVWSDEQQPL